MLARRRVAPPRGSGLVLIDRLPVTLTDGIKWKADNSFRGRPIQAQEPVATARGLEFISDLEGRHPCDNPKQRARRLERRLCFQNSEIVPANPQPAGEKTEESFLARFRILLWLGLEGQDVGAFSSDVPIRKTLPEIPVPQIVFPDRFDGGFGLILFRLDLGFRLRRPGCFCRCRFLGPCLEKRQLSFHALACVFQRAGIAGPND